MVNKPLDSITLADLQFLKDNAVREDKTLEYKREIPGHSQEDKKKILRAICALANTAGGDLIYGIEEAAGIPVAIPGIDSTDEDALRLRFESSCREGIQPRLSQLHFKFVPVSEGLSVLIIRIQKSWNGPHRLGQDGHFYARNSAGSYQLDVGELRQAFTLSEGIIDRIRSFRADRLIRIEADSGPVPLADGVKMIFHMIPFSAFSSSPPQRIELEPLERTAINPIGSSATNGGINLDGYFRYFQAGRETARTYAQFFRNGVIECVASFPPNTNTAERPIPSEYIETQLIKAVTTYRRTLLNAGVGGPFLFFLAFLNVEGSTLLAGGGPFPESAQIIERNTNALILPEVVAENDAFDVAQTLKPLFDSYWNAYGYEGSAHYGSFGHLVHRG